MGRLSNCACIGKLFLQPCLLDRLTYISKDLNRRYRNLHVRWSVSQGTQISETVDLIRAGAAIGSLGRHTPIAPDGMPVFNNRYEVLLKVGHDNLKLIPLMFQS